MPKAHRLTRRSLYKPYNRNTHPVYVRGRGVACIVVFSYTDPRLQTAHEVPVEFSMVGPRDMQALEHRLERARTLLLNGRLSEDVAWCLLCRTRKLIDRAEGSAYQPTLDVIYTLVESLWSNTRQQRTLSELRLVIR